MLYLIVKFEEGDRGSIAKEVEDYGPFVFPDNRASHLFPPKIGTEVLVKITKTNFQETARFCQVVGGPEVVARLLQKRKKRAKRKQARAKQVVDERIKAITAILKKDGVCQKYSEIEVDGFVYRVIGSAYNYEKRRVMNSIYTAQGEVYVKGYGLNPEDDDRQTKITIKDVRFNGQLLNDLPLKDENPSREGRIRPRRDIRVSA